MYKVVAKIDNVKRDKWYREYIEGVNLDNIEWHKFNYDQLIKFYYKNYFDDDYEEFVMTRGEDNDFLPFGMTYLMINPGNTRDEYIVGLCDNNSGTKTIVSCVAFNPNFYVDYDVLRAVTYIKTIETNSFFQRKGVFNKTINEILKFINKDQDVLITPESGMGRMVRVINRMKNAMIELGFDNDIRCEDEVDEEYLNSLKSKKSKKKVL